MNDRDESKIQEARDLLSRLKIRDGEKRKLSAAYEQVNTNGAILIDGNHVLLESLQDIDVFNELVNKTSGSDGSESIWQKKFSKSNIVNIWDPPDPIYTAEFVRDIVWRISESLPLLVVSRIFPGDKIPISNIDFISGTSNDPSKYCPHKYTVVRTANAVDPTVPLHQPHRIPWHVEVDDMAALLEVHSLRQNVRSDQEIV